MKLYHGSSSKFEADENRCIYATANIEEAREYALGLDNLGNHSEVSFIYEIEVDETLAVEISDFMEFDVIGYNDYAAMPDLVHNAESGYFCIKHPRGMRLVESYKNEL